MYTNKKNTKLKKEEREQKIIVFGKRENIQMIENKDNNTNEFFLETTF